ncbi:hypothetical protein BaRGS_00000320 [Batillaria attramentaria]|uniref:G-protein coupled receptors family 1 profile domain-containing protein n=1 Tax=Batillaria attramentaria TaxID=370345 RepID=A0ABD0MAA8_9CAEN
MPTLNRTPVSPVLVSDNRTYTGDGDGMEGLGNEAEDNSWMLLMLQQHMQPQAFDDLTQTLLILAYLLFIVFGVLGNGLVCFVVARNPHMRTPRNIFIINLAISDLTLCVFTQPLNLYLLLKTHWELGSFMCKMVTMQGTNLFVSTISITAIALDRFQVIVYPTKDSMKKVGAAVGLLSVWVISFLMASPSILFQKLEVVQPLRAEFPDYYVYHCYEDGSLAVEKRAYTVALMVVQYILPFIILTVAHLRICNKLRYRMQQQARNNRPASSPYQRQSNERRSRRKRKTNLLLATIALVFGLSWLPLNIFNLLSEFHGELFQSGGANKTVTDAIGSYNWTAEDYPVHDANYSASAGLELHTDVAMLDTAAHEESESGSGKTIKLAYAICHLLVLCSACVNPVVYGWFNDNFRTEFLKILYCPCCKQLQATVKKRVCCDRRQGMAVPAITLTKASNGNSKGYGGVGDGGGEKLTTCGIDEDGVTSNHISETTLCHNR